MADTRGTFRLKNVRQNILNDEYVPVPNVFIANDGFGYSMWQNRSYLTRTNINSGLAYHNPGLTSPFSTHAKSGFSSPSYGYWSGGGDTNGRSFVSKVTYSTGVHESGLPNMSSPVYESGSISAGEKAYIFAGVWSGNSRSYTQRMTYSNETWAQLPGSNTPYSEWYLTGVNSGNGTGYGVGGYGNNPGNTGKITFANDSWSFVPSGFQRTYYGTGKLRTNTNSWYTGGFINTPSQPYHRVSATHKLTYANDTWATNPTATLPYGINDGASYPYNSSKGALVGGARQGGDSGMNSSAFTLTFATDTWDATSIAGDSNKYGTESGHNGGCSAAENLGSNAGIDGVARWIDNVGQGPDAGYIAGGGSGVYGRTFTEKIFMSTDTAQTALPAATLPYSTWAHGASFGNFQYGMMSTGSSPNFSWSSAGNNESYKFTYSTETISQAASVAGVPTTYETDGKGFSTQTTGYYAGGKYAPSNDGRTYVFKYSYSTNTWSNGNSMPRGKYWGTNSQTDTDAYMIAGKGSSPSGGPIWGTLTEKMTFSTDTWGTEPSASVDWDEPNIRMTTNACGDSNAGYWTCGAIQPGGWGYYASTIWKLSYASSTISESGMNTVPSSPGDRYAYGHGLSNASKGYFAGGGPGEIGVNLTTSKFSYATETISSISPSLTETRQCGYSFGARKLGGQLPVPTVTPTSPTSLTGPEGIKAEGYLIQGIQGSTTSPTGRSDSYKLDYSTETWSSSANSTFIRKNGGATSTTTNAYIGGGTFGNVPSLGTNHGGDMDKYTYTTSTFSRIPGSDAGDIPGPAHANKQCAAGNQTQGYWAFGPAQSKCTKLTYSSETASNLPNLPWNAKNAVGVSKQTEGYYGSGDGFDDKNSNFVKITFSNDSYAAYSGWFTQPGGFSARYRCGSSSSTKAYIVGGQNAPRCMDVTPWATNSTSNSPTTFLQSPGFYKAYGQGSNEAGYFTGGAQVGNNGSTTEKITYASDTTAILPGAYFPTSEPSGVNSYSTGGPNMNGLGTNVPNVI